MNQKKITFVGQTEGGLECLKGALEMSFSGQDEFEILFLHDYEKATDHLLNSSSEGKERLSGLIVLSFLEKEKGLEFLKKIKRSEKLHRTPILGFMKEGDQFSVNEAYLHHINCLMHTPKEGDCKNIVKSIKNFWFYIVHLPQL